MTTFSTSTGNKDAAVDSDNPWPGLASYGEADAPFFRGRESVVEVLLDLVASGRVTVLFGLSGVGKTSLLCAGLFPRLRKQGRWPVRIRLSFDAGQPELVAQVKQFIVDEAAATGVETPAWEDSDSLWELLHRKDADFWNSRNRPVLPVLVFNQFEELFTLGYHAKESDRAALRLNEIGFLPRLDRVTAVSAGSIVAAVVGSNWDQLRFDEATGVAQNFDEMVVGPLRQLAEETLDVGLLTSQLLSFGRAGRRLERELARRLFGSKTLQDLPDRPCVVIGATNMQSGVLWRFTKPYMRDWRVGEVNQPTILLATAVAASTAAPPIPPVVLELDERSYTPDSGTDLQYPPFTTRVLCQLYPKPTWMPQTGSRMVERSKSGSTRDRGRTVIRLRSCGTAGKPGGNREHLLQPPRP